MLQNCNIWKIASRFFERPTKPFGLLELSKECDIAHTSTKKYLGQLLKEKIIRTDTLSVSNRFFYLANKEHKTYLMYKKMYNHLKIQESTLISKIMQECSPRSIIVFGSYQKGEDTEHSDIDIFVESAKKEINLRIEERFFQKKIELHFKESFKSYPAELKNSILNGTVLFGFVVGYETQTIK